MHRAKLICLATTISLAACGGPATTDQARNDGTPPGELPAGTASNMVPEVSPPGATAQLRTAEGAMAGTARVSQMGDGLEIRLAVENLPSGEHGVHVHGVGKCDAPTFETAGGHWNPADTRHGLENPQGQHAGDMPNLTVGEDGRGSLTYSLKGGTLAQLMDSDGAAFVVHAGRDDQKTDPAGDSGARIACGVFETGPQDMAR